MKFRKMTVDSCQNTQGALIILQKMQALESKPKKKKRKEKGLMKILFCPKTGDIKGSRPHGWGKLYLAQAPHEKENEKKGRLLYDGQWARGNRHGYGIIYYNSGDIYEGYIVNNKRQVSRTHAFYALELLLGLFCMLVTFL